MFQHGPAEFERGLDVLSDGQQSLFYFALAAAVFDLERKAMADKIKGFDRMSFAFPRSASSASKSPKTISLRITCPASSPRCATLSRMARHKPLSRAHPPSVLSRVEPTEVRYIRCDAEERVSSVLAVELPTDSVRRRQVHPWCTSGLSQLYFARFVVLVEGDSERIVLPRLAQPKDLRWTLPLWQSSPSGTPCPPFLEAPQSAFLSPRDITRP